MKIVKTFEIGQDKEINEYLKENRLGMAGASINLQENNIVVIISTNQRQYADLSMLEQNRQQFAAQIMQKEDAKRWLKMVSLAGKVHGKKNEDELASQMSKIDQELDELNFHMRFIDEQITAIHKELEPLEG